MWSVQAPASRTCWLCSVCVHRGHSELGQKAMSAASQSAGCQRLLDAHRFLTPLKGNKVHQRSTQVRTHLSPHISDKGHDNENRPRSRAAHGHLGRPGHRDQDNKLGSLAHTWNASLGELTGTHLESQPGETGGKRMRSLSSRSQVLPVRSAVGGGEEESEKESCTPSALWQRSYKG